MTELENPEAVLCEMSRIRADLAAPGQSFEMVERAIDGQSIPVYKFMPENLSRVIHDAQNHGPAEFMVDGDHRWTYEDFLPMAAGMSLQLVERYSLEPGDRVVLAGKNSPEWALAYYATILAGAVPVPINSRGSVEDIRRDVRAFDPKLTIADETRLGMVGTDYENNLAVMHRDYGLRDRWGHVFDSSPASVEINDAQPEDVALILPTSGTTGAPKGAMLTHRSLAMFLTTYAHNGAAGLVYEARKLGITPLELASRSPQFATFAIWPFFHMSGSTNLLLAAMRNGGKIVYLDRWDPSVALSLIPREKITVLQGPPGVLWDLMNHTDFVETNLDSVTGVFAGGQVLSSSLIAGIREHFGPVKTGGGYGLTETNGATTQVVGDEFLARPNSQGRALPGVRLRIVAEDGRELPPGDAGELWVRGAVNMSGYFRNEEETASAVTPDGWFRTGDVAVMDEDGFVTIVDRLKDMVKSLGENIYCNEIERVYHQFPGVAEVVAYGVPDERLGERMVVSVLPAANFFPTPEGLLEFARERLPAYKVPTEAEIRDKPFPRNAMDKANKAALRAEHAARQERTD